MRSRKRPAAREASERRASGVRMIDARVRLSDSVCTVSLRADGELTLKTRIRKRTEPKDLLTRLRQCVWH